MATKKKMLQAAAGVGGAGLDVNEVFSTYLYEANSTARSITNGIDLAGEGGLVWLKSRSSTREHALYDTERGAEKLIKSNSTGVQQNTSGGLTSFNSDGFSLGTYADVNGTSYGDFASWSVRKAAKFFDCVTYTGTGSAQTIAHNLGTTVGSIFIKCTSLSRNWSVYHKGLTDPSEHYLLINSTAGAVTHEGAQFWNSTLPTESVFSVGTNANVNHSGATYVAYLFAHNNSDGEFGPDADQDIIKCGSFTTPSSAADTFVDLGFEPQWLLTKTTTAGQWRLFDVMRGMAVDGPSIQLWPTQSYAESTIGTTANYINPNATGFTLTSAGHPSFGNNTPVIYMAIRRGPLYLPTAGTEVFAVGDGSAGASGNAGRYRSGFSVDMGLEKDITGSDNWELVTRLLSGTSLRPNGTNAEDTGVGGAKFDYMDGWNTGTAWADSYSYMWKRAPSYFDSVAYTGDGTSSNATRTAAIPHNLGVQPEMVWVKSRSATSEWVVVHKDYGAGYLNLSNSFNTFPVGGINFDDAFTATDFKIGGWQQENNFNYSGRTFIAYLFATLAGVSKVGSYTGTGAAQNIDCGFTTGARFILLKKTSGTGNWYLFDSTRGIVAGNDPYLYLNTTAAQVTSRDGVDPLSSGFALTTDSTFNASGSTYIFYAIA